MAESQVPSCDPTFADQNKTALEVVEREIRCVHCNRLFTKITFTIDRDFHKDGDVKIGIETKCNRCNGMDNKVFVV